MTRPAPLIFAALGLAALSPVAFYIPITNWVVPVAMSFVLSTGWAITVAAAIWRFGRTGLWTLLGTPMALFAPAVTLSLTFFCVDCV